MEDYIIITVISTFASMIHCLLGFGDALLAMPFLLMFYSLETANTIANNYAFIIGVVLTGYNFRSLKSHKLESIILFFLYTIFTVIGMLFLASVNPNLILIMLSIILILYPGLIYWLQKNNTRPVGKYTSILFGAISGFLGATTTVNGPPLVIYGQLRKFRKDIFVAIIQPVFLWGSIINFYGYYKLGLFNLRLTLIMFASTPIILINAYFCKKIRNKMNQNIFTYFVTGMIFISGVIMLFKYI